MTVFWPRKNLKATKKKKRGKGEAMIMTVGFLIHLFSWGGVAAADDPRTSEDVADSANGGGGEGGGGGGGGYIYL